MVSEDKIFNKIYSSDSESDSASSNDTATMEAKFEAKRIKRERRERLAEHRQEIAELQNARVGWQRWIQRYLHRSCHYCVGYTNAIECRRVDDQLRGLGFLVGRIFSSIRGAKFGILRNYSVSENENLIR